MSRRNGNSGSGTHDLTPSWHCTARSCQLCGKASTRNRSNLRWEHTSKFVNRHLERYGIYLWRDISMFCTKMTSSASLLSLPWITGCQQLRTHTSRPSHRAAPFQKVKKKIAQACTRFRRPGFTVVFNRCLTNKAMLVLGDELNLL